MARVHRFMKEKIGSYQELPHGRLPGQGYVPREAYPEIVRRSKDELLSVIGRDYGVTSETIRRICKRAGQ